jgi:hypothetical protein
VRSGQFRILAVTVALACLASTLSGVAAAQGGNQGGKQLAFPDGTWQGTTLSAGGTITQGDIFGAAEAEVYFEFRVVEAEVAGGGMETSGSSASNVPGATANQTFSGTFELSGPAEEIAFEGLTEFSGTVTAGGLTVPYEGSGEGGGSFFPKTATCSKVTGDLAYRGRQVQAASGFATDVVAPYVALRVKDVEAEKVLAEFDALAVEINLALAAAAVSDGQQVVDQLFELVQRAWTILNHVHALKACGDIPRGFKEGLADGYFAEVFQVLVSALLARRDSLTTAQLLSILGVAYQTGVVGAAAPDLVLAEDILNQFADVLSARVDDALAEGDIQSLTEILAAAEQLGLDDLAAKADAAIDEYLDDQKSGFARGDDRRGLGDLPGVDGEVELTGPPETDAGKVPTFRWKRVDGAAAYRLAVLDSDGDASWAWQGTKTSIVLGAVKDRPRRGEAGPIVTDGMRWSVVALDENGQVVAASRLRDVSP